ncbi:hypothetical protein OPIT5_08275 [Opitutaceae bacterium TAV5]|nr:hypothetical protein OPIT5_08275 [Opitutaceae bacterium TAV5]
MPDTTENPLQQKTAAGSSAGVAVPIVHEPSALTLRRRRIERTFPRPLGLRVLAEYELKFAVLSDFPVHDEFEYFFVKKGFVTDLASVPRIFWRILPPFGRYTLAAVVHDWLYRHQHFCPHNSRWPLIPRVLADRIFLRAMRALGVGLVPRTTIYLAVRAFGWVAWRKNLRNRIRMSRTP